MERGAPPKRYDWLNTHDSQLSSGTNLASARYVYRVFDVTYTARQKDCNTRPAPLLERLEFLGLVANFEYVHFPTLPKKKRAHVREL